MKGTIKITADFSCRHAPARIYAKQGDKNSRFVEVSFCFGGEPFDMSGVSRTEIRVIKPDGSKTSADGMLDVGKAVYPLTEQSLAVGGVGTADFLLYGADGEVISCIPAKLYIVSEYAGEEISAASGGYAELLQRLGGLTLVPITQSGYDELAESVKSDESRLFIITEG